MAFYSIRKNFAMSMVGKVQYTNQIIANGHGRGSVYCPRRPIMRARHAYINIMSATAI